MLTPLYIGLDLSVSGKKRNSNAQSNNIELKLKKSRIYSKNLSFSKSYGRIRENSVVRNSHHPLQISTKTPKPNS